MIRCLWGIVIALMLAGCAGHPLPDDVTRHSTLAIVKAIRCEAGAALQDTPSWADKGAIGLVFDFDIFEHNNATLGLDLKKIFPTGTFTMNVPPSTDLQREGHRRFTIVDALKDLKDLWKPSATACSQEAIQTNFAYPIVGTIGLNEVMHTAIGIDLLGAQGEAVTGSKAFQAGCQRFSPMN
jgi:hypothetical protein